MIFKHSLFLDFGLVKKTSQCKIADSWTLKMIYSLIMIFPILLLMNFLKKSEGVDVYDVVDHKIETFNPEIVWFKFLNEINVHHKKYQKGFE